MAYALVGSAGTATRNATSNSPLTPAWGTGESRTAGNLLICWAGGGNTATFPATPSGWSIAVQEAGTASACSMTIFYMIATGGDAAPTLAAASLTTWSAGLAEFSGNDASAPVDQSGVATGTTSPQAATASAVDAASGELVIYGADFHYTAAAVKTSSFSLNNGMTGNEQSNDATSTVGHFRFGWAITTGNASADSASLTYTTTSIKAAAVVAASFLLPAAAAAGIPDVVMAAN